MEVPSKEYLVPIGKAKVTEKGTDLTLVSHGRTFNTCTKVAHELKKEGISIELIDLRTIKPLDIGTVIKSVQKTHRCVIVEEGHYFSGIASEVGFEVTEFCFDYLDAPVGRVCQRETPMPYSKVLEAETLPNERRIKEKIIETLR